MPAILLATFKGILRDRVFQGLLVAAVAFFFIPAASYLSMRQITELAITLALSLSSFLLLLFAVFLGATALWKDFDRRYVYSVLGFPMSRATFLVGKYAGVVLFIALAAVVLAGLSGLTIFGTALFWPPARPLAWESIAAAALADMLKYALLVAVAFLLATVSTSFFLPIFGTVAAYLAGSVTQQVYEYLQVAPAEEMPELLRSAAMALYYVLPNLALFDFKYQAIYGLPVPPESFLLAVSYALAYTGILLAAATLLFSRREVR